jgi:acyl-CoA synthetase (AMP-forming)/AMP-acid ligase II
VARINDDVDPNTPAAIVAETGDTITYGELEDRSRRLARLLRARGLEVGGHVAVLLDNHLRYFEVMWAARRAGLYLTPINWHLGADEAGYILTDCGATALITSSRFADLTDGLGAQLDAVTTRLSIDGGLDGFDDHEGALAAHPAEPVEDETEGLPMFYSSGTTGRPKGILPPLPGTPFGTGGMADQLAAMYGIGAGTRYLVPAPLYHAAPLGWSLGAQRGGSTVVLMQRFDPETALRAIEEHQVTHAQFVPTHFVRMLKLDPEVRQRYDVSSLQVAIHAAAPCPVEVKHQMFDWWGPILHEYYSGSEGAGFCAVGPDEWLEHPGTVGKALMGTPHIIGDDGTEQPPGEVGQIWFEGAAAFEYHGDPAKTAEAFDAHGWATLGDVGYLDDDGYLYLTDRVSHMIISGGVNIYPQEIEDLLVLHDTVADAGVIGIPDADMGESVLAVIQPADPNVDTDELAAELDRFCREHLAGFKCPRSYRFTDELPRLPTGKLLKRRLREQHGGSTAGGVVSG